VYVRLERKQLWTDEHSKNTRIHSFWLVIQMIGSCQCSCSCRHSFMCVHGPFVCLDVCCSSVAWPYTDHQCITSWWPGLTSHAIQSQQPWAPGQACCRSCWLHISLYSFITRALWLRCCWAKCSQINNTECISNYCSCNKHRSKRYQHCHFLFECCVMNISVNLEKNTDVT